MKKMKEMISLKEELISVIVPVYNSWRYTKKCIETIVNQTYKNLEILLIDDGSTDKSGLVCDEWQKKDERIIVIHKENGGAADARNTGLDIAKGTIIAFVDGDDYIEQDMIEILYKNMIETGAQIVSGGYFKEYFYSETVEYAKENYIMTPKEAYERMLTRNDFGNEIWDRLYKKELFEDLRFELNKIPEDVGMTFKILDKANKISHIDKPVYHYIQRQGSVEHKKYEIAQTGAVDFSEELIKLMEKKYPNLVGYAEKFFVMALNNNIVLCYRNGFKEEYKKLIEKSKIYMKRILKCSEIEIGRKIRSILITYLGFSRIFKK